MSALKIVRKWEHIHPMDKTEDIWIQLDNGMFGWFDPVNNKLDLIVWSGAVFMAGDRTYNACNGLEPPTWEDSTWIGAVPTVQTIAKPPDPSLCAYATAQVIKSVPGETVELWRYEAPEEVQLAPARDRVMRRAKRLLRDIPICGGNETPVELMIESEPIAVGSKHSVNLFAAFKCGMCGR